MAAQCPVHICLATFKATDPEELSVKNGGRVFVLASQPTGWMYCCKPKGKKGFVPSTFLSPNPVSFDVLPEGVRMKKILTRSKKLPRLPSSRPERIPADKAAKNAPWFLGKIDRETAKSQARILQQTGPVGSFIVRIPDSQPTSYGLTVKTGPEKMQNFLIKCENEKFVLSDTKSSSLSGLIRKLSRHDSALPVRLVVVNADSDDDQLTVVTTEPEVKKKKHKKHHHHRKHQPQAAPLGSIHEGGHSDISSDEDDDDDVEIVVAKAQYSTADEEEDPPQNTGVKDSLLFAAVQRKVSESELPEMDQSHDTPPPPTRPLTLDVLQELAESTGFLTQNGMRIVSADIQPKKGIKQTIIERLIASLPQLQFEMVQIIASSKPTPEDLQALSALHFLQSLKFLDDFQAEKIGTGGSITVLQTQYDRYQLEMSKWRPPVRQPDPIVKTAPASTPAPAPAVVATVSKEAQRQAIEGATHTPTIRETKTPPPPPIRSSSLSHKRRPELVKKAEESVKKLEESSETETEVEEPVTRRKKIVSFRDRHSIVDPEFQISDNIAEDPISETTTDTYDFHRDTAVSSTDTHHLAGLPQIDASTDVKRISKLPETITFINETTSSTLECSLHSFEKACASAVPSDHVLTVADNQFSCVPCLIDALESDELVVKLSDASILWSLANNLNLPDICRQVSKFMLMSLSVSNAMYFLETGYQLGIAEVETAAFQIVCAFAKECFEVKGSLNVSLALFSRLLQSDQLCLEEEDVFDLMLCYCKYAADVTNPDSWTPSNQGCDDDDDDDDGFGFGFGEEETVDPVDEHIRHEVSTKMTSLLQYIHWEYTSSTFFPTKVVPLQIVSPTWESIVEEKQNLRTSYIQCRQGCYPMATSELLAYEQQKLINAWWGHSNQKWKPLYKASKDGFDAATFHRKCQSRRPTCTIFKTTEDDIFGAVVDQPWSKLTSGPLLSNQKRSFVFVMSSSVPRKFNYNGTGGVIYCHAESGPCFGGGDGTACDIRIVNNANTCQESTCNFPQSYGDPHSNLTFQALTKSKFFQVAEIEVFGLESASLSTSFI